MSLNLNYQIFCTLFLVKKEFYFNIFCENLIKNFIYLLFHSEILSLDKSYFNTRMQSSFKRTSFFN